MEEELELFPLFAQMEESKLVFCATAPALLAPPALDLTATQSALPISEMMDSSAVLPNTAAEVAMLITLVTGSAIGVCLDAVKPIMELETVSSGELWLPQVQNRLL